MLNKIDIKITAFYGNTILKSFDDLTVKSILDLKSYLTFGISNKKPKEINLESLLPIANEMLQNEQPHLTKK